MNYKKLFLVEKNTLYEKKKLIKYFEEIKDEVIIFIDKSEKIRVSSSICPHFGGEIYFDFNKDILRCKWHDWKYCKNTGECLTHSIKGRLKQYDFEVKPNKLKKYDHEIKENKIYLVINE